ncbi:transcriptional regulator [Enterovibrio norvegicus FF-33]|uniref:helix-turn-helix transcriptional regulator n=1 Tax=Enterovibrio norvegicus TaxID=188144 RepID=UPI00035DD4E4|nr:AlpA family phage regulatory protein [Enterovibrio norvegicus]OEE69829.1 transcriptional regulator [Enterovibrio norvegicus FF-33]
MATPTTSNKSLPPLLRIEQVLELIPISRTSWYRGIQDGLYPQSIKIGPRIAVWRRSDIEQLLTVLSREVDDE